MRSWRKTVMELSRLPAPPVEGQAYGMEIELENCRNPYGMLDGFMVVEDGSLRNNGAEFLTMPLNLEETKVRLAGLYAVKREQGWVGSQRCGIHVHMDMSHRTLKELQAILIGYACVEPVLFHLCGPEREENIFCVPWYRAPSDLKHVRKFLYSATQRDLAGLRAVLQKYTALFVEPLRRFNTIEFRGAPVFQTEQEVFRLLDYLDDLIRQAQEYDPEELLDLFIDSPATGLAALLPRCAGRADMVALLEQADSVATAMNLVRTRPGSAWTAYGVPADVPEEAFVPAGGRMRRERPMIDDLLAVPGELRMGQQIGVNMQRGPARRR